MDKIIEFFINIGKLKTIPRQGWVLRGIKNPESIAEHSFRAAIMAWILAEQKHKKLNLEKLLKMALVHDMCDIFAGDTTPYDSILPKNNKERQEILKTWPRFSEGDKKKLSEEKYKKEILGLEKLIKDLPNKLKNEIKNLWLDCEKGLSPEGRFFGHTNKLENLLQATEYWKAGKNPSLKSFWIQARELHDDPTILEFIDQIDKEFYKKENA